MVHQLKKLKKDLTRILGRRSVLRMPSTPAKTERDELAKMVFECRNQKGLSLMQMAKALKLSAAGLSKIERGKVKPNRTTEARIVAFLNRHGYYPAVAA
jgi:ribosome-binding protein aMBF1 (putative translation factor)